MYAITNLISLQLAELQSEPVLNMLQKYHNVTQHVNTKACSHIDNEINYDEKLHYFTIHKMYHLHKNIPVVNTI